MTFENPPELARTRDRAVALMNATRDAAILALGKAIALQGVAEKLAHQALGTLDFAMMGASVEAAREAAALLHDVRMVIALLREPEANPTEPA